MEPDDEVDDGRGDDDLGQDSRQEGEHLAQVEGQRPEEPGRDLSASEGNVLRELVDESVKDWKGALADVDEKDALEKE